MRAEFERVTVQLSHDVHALRARNDWSQEATAAAAGIDADTLLAIEKATSDARLSTIIRLAYVLGQRLEIRLVPVTA